VSVPPRYWPIGPVTAHDAMTRDDDRQGIRRAGGADGAYRRGMPTTAAIEA
jgi:hypothetical protein